MFLNPSHHSIGAKKSASIRAAEEAEGALNVFVEFLVFLG